MSRRSIHLPNLVSICEPFELRSNRHCRTVTTACRKWALDNLVFSQDEQDTLQGLQIGLLAALCYPTCDLAQLQLIARFFLVLLHWTDVPSTSVCAQAEPAFQTIWTQVIRASTEHWQTRFQRHLRAFREAQLRVAADNQAGTVPSLKEYMAFRRDSSGVQMGFDLIEYAEGLCMSDEAYAMPVIQQLRKDAGDIVSYASDIASCIRKLIKGDKHNLIAVLMAEKHVTLQGALDAAGDLMKTAVDHFLVNERLLPRCKSGAEVEADVRRYVQGLRDAIAGVVHWVYETERFFGQNGEEVRTFGWVFLPSELREPPST
ncbi:terpenoid synthase [Amylocystis lapponica]|nr:terpenoid synthase [Amylocystis lapponica]